MLIFAYCSLFIGAIFWRLGDDADGLRNRLTLLYSQAQLFLLMVGFEPWICILHLKFFPWDAPPRPRPQPAPLRPTAS
jgi:hypothetical protein